MNRVSTRRWQDQCIPSYTISMNSSTGCGVVVGWDRVGRNEDPDAPRRLYYVAMTRARKSLTLARFDERHSLLDALPETPDILHRAPVRLPQPTPDLARRYQRLALRDVDLGFAGRHALTSSVHEAIAALSAGDPLRLRPALKRWELADTRGRTVGRLARAYAPPASMRCITAQVAAIIIRQREDTEPEYRDSVRCERWEVVMPELVFEPKP